MLAMQGAVSAIGSVDLPYAANIFGVHHFTCAVTFREHVLAS